ncbi:MAG TPA: protease pro-enzyme activation domain-containing protein [Candidatus Paceibacterota bacterium]|nr:protease pro-enzyme activation domain-containing protein [Candidatus Paceibacterota bacterium]
MKHIIFSKVATISVIIGAIFIVQSALADNPPLIIGPINNNDLVTVTGTAQPLAGGVTDQGSVPGGTNLGTVIIALKLYPNPPVTADQYNAELQDPSSPYYHQWLTPQEYGTMFGISTQDIQTITAWLQSYGLTVSDVATSRGSIDVTGTASQLEAAFHAQLDYFYDQQASQQFIGLKSDIKIPAALQEAMTGPVFGPPAIAMGGGGGVGIVSVTVPTLTSTTAKTPTSTVVSITTTATTTTTISSSSAQAQGNSNAPAPLTFWQKIVDFFKNLFRF